MRFLNFNNKLFLVEQVVASLETKVTASNINHVLIYDRSYSMYRELSRLGADVLEKVKELPVGDTITLGWFSGEGQFNFILKGYKISGDNDFKVLEKAINANLSPVGCTCFSEILAGTDQVVQDLSAISNTFSLTFFTDGYPVVSNYRSEIDSIQKAVKLIEGKIASSLFVGYGNYYNKSLMATMANGLGGSLVHCSSLLEYKNSLAEFMTGAAESNPKVNVTLGMDNQKGDLVFGIRNHDISSYAVVDGGNISFAPKKTGSSSIFVLTKCAPANSEEVEISKTTLTARDPLIKGAYAASYLLTQTAKSDVALEILGSLGDRALIDSVNNAFTLAEYGKTENKIKRAVTHPTYGRFTEGRDTNYLPAKDAFCVLDVMDILLADEESYFLPYHKDFKYRRIGPSAKPKNEYPKFHPDLESQCAFSSLVWNKTKLNLSILAKIKGSVEFKEGYAEQGFQKNFPSFVYRNYALVKDGFLNVNKIPVKLSASTKRILDEKGLLEGGLLCLDKLPVINRTIAEGKTSAKEMCKTAYQEIKLQADLKALKFKREEIEPKKDSLKNDFFTDEQINFLATKGIGKNGFSPEMEKPEVKDFYHAKEFQIKIKGLSSLPSITAVREKVTNGKKLTASATLVQEGLGLFTHYQSKPKKVQLSEIDSMIEERQKKLFGLRQSLQRTKFAILLASKWFDEFDTREDCKLEVDGNQFTFGVREVKVNI